MEEKYGTVVSKAFNDALEDVIVDKAKKHLQQVVVGSKATHHTERTQACGHRISEVRKASNHHHLVENLKRRNTR